MQFEYASEKTMENTCHYDNAKLGFVTKHNPGCPKVAILNFLNKNLITSYKFRIWKIGNLQDTR